MKIYQDEVKLRHTSHWDVDTMSRAEYEAYMAGEASAPGEPVRDHAPAPIIGCAAACGRPAVAPTLWERFMRLCLPRQ